MEALRAENARLKGEGVDATHPTKMPSQDLLAQPGVDPFQQCLAN